MRVNFFFSTFKSKIKLRKERWRKNYQNPLNGTSAPVQALDHKSNLLSLDYCALHLVMSISVYSPSDETCMACKGLYKQCNSWLRHKETFLNQQVSKWLISPSYIWKRKNSSRGHIGISCLLTLIWNGSHLKWSK